MTALVLAFVALASAVGIVGQQSAGRTITLNYDDYVYWGPLTAPAVFTLLGLKLVNSTGTFGGTGQRESRAAAAVRAHSIVRDRRAHDCQTQCSRASAPAATE